MTFAAFFNLYKMCTLLHRSKVNISRKIGSTIQYFLPVVVYRLITQVEAELSDATPMRAWAIAKAFELGMSVADVPQAERMKRRL